jgi:hypothetical protein
MLSLRSLAAILCSAIRLSRAAFVRSPLGSKALINTQKKAANKPPNMATNMATDRAASIAVSSRTVYAFQGSEGNTPANSSAIIGDKIQSSALPGRFEIVRVGSFTPLGKRQVQDDVFFRWAAGPQRLSAVSLGRAKFAGICYLLGFVSVNTIYSQ